MKKVLFFLFMTVILSCQKADLNDDAMPLTFAPMPIKIFAKNSESLKQIIFGDSVQAIRDVNLLFFSEDDGYEPINCHWKFSFQPLLGEEMVTTAYGDQISFKPIHYGLYHVFVSLDPGNTFIVSEFYLLINGVPGKIGDSPENNSIFRMEKKRLENGYLFWEVYYKYQFQLNDAALAFTELSIYDMNGAQLSQETFNLSKSAINQDYYYFLMPHNNAALTRLKFKSNFNGEIFVDLNNYLSVFSDHVGINFIASPNYNDPDPACGDSITFIYNGEEVTYGTVESGGKCWMDRDLGASRAAISSTDSESYGDLYQWGRLSDGHQLKSNTGWTYSLSSSDVPGHSLFIITDNEITDWRSPSNNNLWQGLTGVNNPCPPGWRVPTETELNSERLSWGQNNAEGAFDSPLKWSRGGGRIHGLNNLHDNSYGMYWTSSIDENRAKYLLTTSIGSSITAGDRGYGYSVRCVR
jgi:uncharacterized protein (TIGR02145 family)